MRILCGSVRLFDGSMWLFSGSMWVLSGSMLGPIHGLDVLDMGPVAGTHAGPMRDQCGTNVEPVYKNIHYLPVTKLQLISNFGY